MRSLLPSIAVLLVCFTFLLSHQLCDGNDQSDSLRGSRREGKPAFSKRLGNWLYKGYRHSRHIGGKKRSLALHMGVLALVHPAGMLFAPVGYAFSKWRNHASAEQKKKGEKHKGRN
jgi:hypothetical protein